MLNAEEAQRIVAAPLMGEDGVKRGTVQQVLVNGSNGEPEWLLVAVGTHGETRRVLPADQATLSDHRVRVPYSRQLFTEAPQTVADNDVPSPEEAAVLYRHFGVDQHE